MTTDYDWTMMIATTATMIVMQTYDANSKRKSVATHEGPLWLSESSVLSSAFAAFASMCPRKKHSRNAQLLPFGGQQNEESIFSNLQSQRKRKRKKTVPKEKKKWKKWFKRKRKNEKKRFKKKKCQTYQMALFQLSIRPWSNLGEVHLVPWPDLKGKAVSHLIGAIFSNRIQ